MPPPLLSPSLIFSNITTTTASISPSSPPHILPHNIRPGILLLSFLICFLGTYTTTQLYSQSRLSSSTPQRLSWLLLASLSFGGCAMWSFHFVAMMAVNTGVQVSFDAGLTALSALFAVMGSAGGLGFNIFSRLGTDGLEEEEGGYTALPTDEERRSRSASEAAEYSLLSSFNRSLRNSKKQSFFSSIRPPPSLTNPRVHTVALLMSLTVSGMHYIGMSALILPPGGYTSYNTPLVFLSVVVAYAVCVIAVSYIHTGGLLFSFIAAIGINAMHWTGMAAATFYTTSLPPYNNDGFPDSLPLTVAFVSLVTMLLSYVALARNAVRAMEVMITKRRLWKAVAEKEAADRSNRIKTDFINVASHELRTPLHAITGFTDLLELTTLNEEQREFVESIKSSCYALDLISRNVLDFARLEDGVGDTAVTSLVDVGGLCKSTLKTFAATGAEKVDLVFILEEGVGRARLDETYFARVLMNLVGNALKFTTEGYVLVHVSTTGEGEGDLIVRVHDTGIGISPSSQGVIFEPFQQADSSLTRKHLGTGLGLTIVRQLVKKMGGKISLKSTLGKGSCFEVVLSDAVQRQQPRWEEVRRKEKLKVAVLLKPDTAKKAGEALGKYFDVSIMEQTPSTLTRRTSFPLSSSVADWKKAAASADRVVIDYSYLTPDMLSLVESAPVGQAWFCFGERVDTADVPGMIKVLPKRPIVIDCEFVELLRIGRNAVEEVLVNGATNGAASIPLQTITPSTSPTSLPTDNNKLPPPQHTNNPPRPSPPTTTKNAPAILLVEDNPVNQRLGIKFLENLGFPHDVAENGAVALSMITSSPSKYSLILMDTQMPVLDGLETTRRIREMERDGKLRGRVFIVSLTANVSRESRRECESAGADGFLAKPLTLGRLRGEVGRWLSVQ